MPVTKNGPTKQEPNLGECLRALREANNWTLATVSKKTGLATSTLSRIENDQISLTYEKLLQLCRGLDIDLAELFAGGANQLKPNQLARRSYSPPNTGRALQADHYYYRYLCTDLAKKSMTPIYGVVTAKTLDDVGGFLRHGGEELVMVLKGTLELHTEFYEPLLVEQGGCVYFDSTMGHAFVVAEGDSVEFISVCSKSESELVEAEKGRAKAKHPPLLLPNSGSATLVTDVTRERNAPVARQTRKNIRRT